MTTTFSGHNATTSTASGSTQYWTYTFDPEPPRLTLVGRFAAWYWVRFVLGTNGERCLCKIGLGRLCGWLEDHCQDQPRFSARKKAKP